MDKTINDRIERLEKELAELKAIVNAPVDNRVDFGNEVKFNLDYSGKAAGIGNIIAKDSDRHKVIVAGNGYCWKLHEDYYRGRTAVSLYKII